MSEDIQQYRQSNTPSPIIFPSSSPTPKLYSTPNKKLPDGQQWQEIAPQNSANIASYHSDPLVAFYGREKSIYYPFTVRAISPLSMMSDSLLDEEDMVSYKFSEQDYLSSIISSRSSSPLRRRPVSFTSPSPLQKETLEEEEEVEEHVTDHSLVSAPIIEKSRRFSLDGQIIELSKCKNQFANTTPSSSKFNNFISKVKKLASGKSSKFK
ncbi:MAG: hypothetical protein EXX96DRAFT_618960 [Benjaminiella poitrasii]|nr:MAG: hypothetical protein EXX96DRAFT_618960 [Benjaminiella poitrasii]